ncbi:conserved protein of unknown function [Rhodovastum atsumiense]|nr:conserved protein of unknown function [Rhodovastum atsumiense]
MGLGGAAVALGLVLHAPPGRAETPRGQTQPALRAMTIVNHTQVNVSELYVSPATVDQWGFDRLGESPLRAGGSLRIQLGRSRDCLYDVKVIYEDASQEERRGQNICRSRQVAFDGSAAIAPPEIGAEHRITLLNQSARPIKQVYLSAAEAAQWGEDRLADASLSVGDERDLSWRGPCTMDLRVVFENRSAEERRDLDLCASAALSIEPGWTTADVPPRPKDGPATGIVVVNRSGRPVTELYLLAEGTPANSRDLLGTTVLPDGGTITLTLARTTSCRYSAHVVFSGPDAGSDIAGVDLCKTTRIEIPPP